jgi:MFS superfamily sulfate permease-like transporter
MDSASWKNLVRPGAPEKWAPGVLAAVAVFLIGRDWAWRPRWLAASCRYHAPIVAVIMIVVVNMIPDAGRNGWLAPVELGTSPRLMFELWPWAHLHPVPAHGNVTVAALDAAASVGHRPVPSVKWDLLWGGGLFGMTMIEVVLIGLLGMLEDLAMVHKATAVADPTGAGAVDMSWEVQVQGLMNIVASLLCGLPAAMVGSYSFAALKFGGGGRAFYVTQAVGSAVVLGLAGFIIETLPNMVPCFILFWVALQMAGWGLWDMRPVGFLDCGGVRKDALDPLEYGLVWVMVIVSLDPIGLNAVDKSGTLIFTVMMFFGVFFSFFHTIRQLRKMSAFNLEGDIRSVRSDVLRTRQDDELLSIEGRRVLVLRLARSVISFHNVGQLEHRIEQLVEQRQKELTEKTLDGKNCGNILAIIIDLSLVEGYTVDAGQMFLEMLPLAAKYSVRVVLCGATTAVIDRLVLFGAPLRDVEVAQVCSRTVLHAACLRIAVPSHTLEKSRCTLTHIFIDGGCRLTD